MKATLIIGIASVLTLSMNVASAQTGATSDTGNAAATNELAEVIVTGTRRLDRTVAESSAPIDVLTGAELASYPAASMLDTLVQPRAVVYRRPECNFRCVQLRSLPVIARPACRRDAGDAQRQTHEPLRTGAGVPGW